jgi:hypothetical protein
VGITDFIFDTPEPVLIDKAVKETQAAMTKAGASGDQFLAAHSLGTVMTQDYIVKNPDTFKG